MENQRLNYLIFRILATTDMMPIFGIILLLSAVLFENSAIAISFIFAPIILVFIFTFITSEKVDNSTKRKIIEEFALDSIKSKIVIRTKSTSDCFVRSIVLITILVLPNEFLSKIDKYSGRIAHEIGHAKESGGSVEILASILLFFLHFILIILTIGMIILIIQIGYSILNESDYPENYNDLFPYFIFVVIIFLVRRTVSRWRRDVLFRYEHMADLFAYFHRSTDLIKWLNDGVKIDSALGEELKQEEYELTHPTFKERLNFILEQRLYSDKNVMLSLFVSFIIYFSLVYIAGILYINADNYNRIGASILLSLPLMAFPAVALSDIELISSRQNFIRSSILFLVPTLVLFLLINLLIVILRYTNLDDPGVKWYEILVSFGFSFIFLLTSYPVYIMSNLIFKNLNAIFSGFAFVIFLTIKFVLLFLIIAQESVYNLFYTEYVQWLLAALLSACSFLGAVFIFRSRWETTLIDKEGQLPQTPQM